MVSGTPETISADSSAIGKEFFDYYRTPRGRHPRSTTALSRTSDASLMLFDWAFERLDWISPRPVLFITGDHVHSRIFREHAFRRASEPKELYVVPTPGTWICTTGWSSFRGTSSRPSSISICNKEEHSMKATLMYRAGDVRVENVPDATITESTDALIRVARACICGSDLWPYKLLQESKPQAMGHEAIGVVEAVGAGVRKVKRGDFVIMPFAVSDGTCAFCREHLNTSCVQGGFFGNGQVGLGGAQAEAIRVPQADGTLFVVPGPPDEALMPGLLTLSDVMGTGHHAAVSAGVSRGRKAAVVGDGAVGLCAVIAAKRLGAEQIILLGRHADRIALAKQFGATDIVSERGEAAAERVRKLTGGFGAHCVLECVGSAQAMATALAIVRPGGAVGRVGVPHYDGIPAPPQTFYHNVSVAGGPAPVRAYMQELLPDVLEGRIEPGRVFDREIGLDAVPAGYRAMDQRESIKVMVTP